MRLRSDEDRAHVEQLHDLGQDHLVRPLSSAAINGVEANRSPHIVSVYLPEVEASALVRRAAEGVAVSMGSACSTNDVEPSHVLVAMGLEDPKH